jgi:hypothetical protein
MRSSRPRERPGRIPNEERSSRPNRDSIQRSWIRLPTEHDSPTPIRTCLAECARLGRSRVGRRRDLVEFRCFWSRNVAAAEDGSTPGATHVRAPSRRSSLARDSCHRRRPKRPCARSLCPKGAWCTRSKAVPDVREDRCFAWSNTPANETRPRNGLRELFTQIWYCSPPCFF